MASLSFAAPEQPPDRSLTPFVWQPLEPLIGLPPPDVSSPSPPDPPRLLTARFDLVQTPALVRAPRTLHGWSPELSETGDERQTVDIQTYAIGDLRITMGSAEQVLTVGQTEPALSGVVVMVEAPGMAPWRLRRTDVPSGVDFGVGRLDPVGPEPQVLIGVYAGGRRCCAEYVLLTPDGTAWRETIVNPSELEGGAQGRPEGWPIDRDGDGAPEFEFFESWDNYLGEAWPPPIYRQVRGGEVVDVTGSPGLRPTLKAIMAKAEAACRRHDNVGCATLVLMAGRLGGEDRAWRILLANYDRNGAEGTYFPEHTRIYGSDGSVAWK